MSELLIEAFRRAKEAALAADAPEDGGTCNFDSPTVKVEGTEFLLETYAAQAGITVSKVTSSKRDYWTGWYFVEVPLRGQGNRRCRMMEAALAVLREYEAKIPGLKVRGYYQMD